MAITITHKSPDYDKHTIKGRYVRYDPGENLYRWCETASIGRGDKKRILDVAVGIVDEPDLPPGVAAAARNNCVIYPPYVEWPL